MFKQFRWHDDQRLGFPYFAFVKGYVSAFEYSEWAREVGLISVLNFCYQLSSAQCEVDVATPLSAERTRERDLVVFDADLIEPFADSFS